VWFKAPDDALKDVKLFLAHVMTYGTLSDISTVLEDFSESDFEATINDPPPGVFDAVPGSTGMCGIIVSQCHLCPSGRSRVARSRAQT